MSGFSFKSSLGSGFVNGLARFSFDSVKPSQPGQLLVNSVEQDQLFGTRLGGCRRCMEFSRMLRYTLKKNCNHIVLFYYSCCCICFKSLVIDPTNGMK
ncbi:hypothetical protein Hanom_Chr10g00942121 [Helianthus anomalus]